MAKKRREETIYVDWCKIQEDGASGGSSGPEAFLQTDGRRRLEGVQIKEVRIMQDSGNGDSQLIDV